MTTKEFKQTVIDNKEFLRGKEIVISVVTSSGIKKHVLDTLRSFGNMVLELEKLEAGFCFTKVSNSFTQKRIVSDSEFSKWTSKGVWDQVYITASTL